MIFLVKVVSNKGMFYFFVLVFVLLNLCPSYNIFDWF